jgi:U3 small nucleolar RNA-associated protein 15
MASHHFMLAPTLLHTYSTDPDNLWCYSLQVLIYDGQRHTLKKTVARFPDTAYCGTFRSDGLLLAAGCESGIVQVFDLGSRAVLRQFKLHKRPAHAVCFSPDKTHLFSASDDTTVRLWDLAQGEQLLRMDGHTDYVRSALPASDDLWVTGSYDHSVKLWDVRTKAAVMTLEHGSPVEDIDQFLSSRMLASVGGMSIALWDLVAGRALARTTIHQKTVTSVQAVNVVKRGVGDGIRLLSASLDGHVKVYSLDTFKVQYAYKYPAPLLSAKVAPDLTSMAVGMTDRTLTVRKHRRPQGVIVAAGATRLIFSLQTMSVRVLCCLAGRVRTSPSELKKAGCLDFNLMAVWMRIGLLL